jgi:hypothetical protein
MDKYENYLQQRGIHSNTENLTRYSIVKTSDSVGECFDFKWRNINGEVIDTTSRRKLYANSALGETRFILQNWNDPRNIGVYIPKKYNGFFPKAAWFVEGEVKTISVVENLGVHAFGFVGVFGLLSVDPHKLYELGLRTIYACYDSDVFKKLTLINAVLRAKKVFESAKIHFNVIDRIGAPYKGIDDELASCKNSISKNFVLESIAASKTTLDKIRNIFDFNETSYTILPYFTQYEDGKMVSLKTDNTSANAQKPYSAATLLSKTVQNPKVSKLVLAYALEVAKATDMSKKMAVAFYIKNCLALESRNTTIVNYVYSPKFENQNSIIDVENETQIIQTPIFPQKLSTNILKDLTTHLFLGNTKTIEYILKWAAYCVFGERKLSTVLVLHSLQQGSGKSNCAKLICKLIGDISTTILSQGRLLQLGKFNSFIIGKRLIVFDDIILRNNTETSKFLAEFNALVTSDTTLIERKGKEPYTYKLESNFLITTNTDLSQVEFPGGFQRRLVIPKISKLSAMEIRHTPTLNTMFSNLNKIISDVENIELNKISNELLNYYNPEFNEFEWLDCEELVGYSNELMTSRFNVFVILLSNLVKAGWPYSVISVSHLVILVGTFLGEQHTDKILQTIANLQRNKIVLEVEQKDDGLYYALNSQYITLNKHPRQTHTDQLKMYRANLEKINEYLVSCTYAMSIQKLAVPECKLKQIAILN